MSTSNAIAAASASIRRSSLRVVVVSPVRLLREGLAQMLRQRPRVESVLGVAAAGDLARIRESFHPNLVLIDVTTEDGLRAVRHLGTAASDVPLLGFGAQERDEDVLLYAEAGLSGYIGRDASTDDLFDAIDRVTSGELLCSPRAAALMFRRLSALAGRDHGDDEARALTPREREIVLRIDAGLSNKAIARELRIGLSTVKNHVHRILEKLAVTRRGEAAARVRGLGARPDRRIEGGPRARDLGSSDPTA